MEPVELLAECLLQRKQLLSAILDVTRQMEARSTQEEIWLDELLDRRQVYLERLQKCAGLIQAQLAALSPQVRSLYQAATDDSAPIHPDCPSETAEIINQCRVLRQRILAADQSIRNMILARQAELRRKTDKLSKTPGTRMADWSGTKA